jgi:hypothetical protein
MSIDEIGNWSGNAAVVQSRFHKRSLPGAVFLETPVLDLASAAAAEGRTEGLDPGRARFQKLNERSAPAG